MVHGDREIVEADSLDGLEAALVTLHRDGERGIYELVEVDEAGVEVRFAEARLMRRVDVVALGGE